MKFLYLIFLLAAITASAQTNHTPWCCRFPLRVMGPTAGVNLKPLCDWWIQNGGQNEEKAAADPGYLDPNRPLTAWKRITGFKTSDLDGVWVVQAEIYTSPSSRTNEWILLKRPPATEEQQYYYLQSLIAQDDQQIVADARVNETDAKDAQKQESRAQAVDDSYSKGVRNYGVDHATRAAQYRKDANAVLADETQYKQGREQALKEFNAIPNDHGRYKLDIFALELGRNSKGQMIFDAGQIYTATP